MNLQYIEKYKGCILGGAIGDAWGSAYENKQTLNHETTYFIFGKLNIEPDWQLTDDTILTLATCEALKEGYCTPDLLAKKFLTYYLKKEIVGIGSSTLKALQELEYGGHWSQVGRKGEYGAGNGAAMRIAPFAFYEEYQREHIRDFSIITHNNDEAYVGALAVYLTIKFILENSFVSGMSVFDMLIAKLPDTRVRDRIIDIRTNYLNCSISEVARLGNNSYVVNSVPFSIFSATKIFEYDFESILQQIIACGGDTDTNASIAGQIMGTVLGFQQIPQKLLEKLTQQNAYRKIQELILI